MHLPVRYTPTNGSIRQFLWIALDDNRGRLIQDRLARASFFARFDWHEWKNERFAPAGAVRTKTAGSVGRRSRSSGYNE